MKRLTNILKGILLGLIGTVFMVIFLPIMIIVTPFTYYANWTRERELKKYLSRLGDKNFFCYNNRTDAKEFIEKELIPKLDKDIELIYLDRKVFKTATGCSRALAVILPDKFDYKNS